METLTPVRMAKPNSARHEFHFCYVWTIDHMICYLAEVSGNPKTYCS